ncbi:hypothetical protein IJG91_00565 [Candidatus Saccharibacteria bacterium]|nr:hypothetical protein [Candidatus Saccharibacteria bacterium]
MGTGTSFDVSSYPGYQSFTTDNFLISDVTNASIPTNTTTYPFADAGWARGVRHPVGYYGGNISETKNYNSSTGILTFYITGSGSGGAVETGCSSNCQRLVYSNSANTTVHAYLVY